MIGQHNLLKSIDRMIQNGFPRFTIIYGSRGTGKMMISKHIAKEMKAQLITCETKVEEIRNIIALAYKQSEPTIYLLPNADKMSPAAKNAILKVTEEPPRKAYFIMTLEDPSNTLATLRSRGTLLSMDQYTQEDILDYLKEKDYLDTLSAQEEKVVLSLCTNPGEVELLLTYDILAFYKFVETVVDNIRVVSGANAFKIGLKLHYKENDNGWDITLFMRAVMNIYLDKLKDKFCVEYYESILVTSKYLAELSITGINKSATIDMWILDMRKIETE